MRKLLTLGMAIASLSASGLVAGPGAGAAPLPEVRPDTLTLVQRGPPWAACRRWDARRRVCLDAGWRNRHWRGWYGRSTCRVRGHGWWIDQWGRWRRC